MWPTHEVIETGPNGNWSRLIRHCYSRAEAQKIADAYNERFPNGNYIVIGP